MKNTIFNKLAKRNFFNPCIRLNRKLIIVIGMGVSVLAFSGCTENTNSKSTRPDIVIILADDMGFSDIGCFGGEIETPNIDKLASQGMSFTQFYNAGRCCPSRASLLTGLYPHQAGVGAMVSPGDRPGYLGRLNESSATFAEVLQRSGYQTFLSGKWRLGALQYGKGSDRNE
jgi:arylsulfatase A-like enzyme